MSTSVDLGTDDDALIRVSFEDEHLDFLREFAGSCFHLGPFRSRGGTTHNWILDCREGLGEGNYARQIAAELVDRAEDVSQFVGSGFGAYLLLGAILGVQGAGVRAAMVREGRKTYGRRRLIEGRLCTRQPVCVVDDVLNSGATACQVVDALRDAGCQDISYACIFRYRWGNGFGRLADRKVDCRWLAEVSRTQPVNVQRSGNSSCVKTWHRLVSRSERLRRILRICRCRPSVRSASPKASPEFQESEGACQP